MAGAYKLPLVVVNDGPVAPVAVGATYLSKIRPLTEGGNGFVPGPANRWRINTINIPCILSANTVGATAAPTASFMLYDNYEMFYSTSFVGLPLAAYFLPVPIFEDLTNPHDYINGRQLQWQWTFTNTDTVAVSFALFLNQVVSGSGFRGANGNLAYDELVYTAPTPAVAISNL